MIPRAGIPIAALLILTLTIPALADGTREKGSRVRSVAGGIYHSGAAAMEQTEGAITNCLKRTFNVFNPCLDLIKGCTGMVLAPIQAPLDYLAASKVKPRPARARTKPRPKGGAAPETPEKAE